MTCLSALSRRKRFAHIPEREEGQYRIAARPGVPDNPPAERGYEQRGSQLDHELHLGDRGRRAQSFTALISFPVPKMQMPRQVYSLYGAFHHKPPHSHMEGVGAGAARDLLVARNLRRTSECVNTPNW